MLYVLISLPCMTSSSFTLRLFIGYFRHKYWKFIYTAVWIWLLYLKYLLSFILLLFWFQCSDSHSKIWYIFQMYFTIKELFYTEPQLLTQCKFWNSHHGHQLTATHYIVCYLILCFLSILYNQDVPFHEFVVLSITIVVVPTWEFVGREVGRIWQLATESGRGRKHWRSSQRQWINGEPSPPPPNP